MSGFFDPGKGRHLDGDDATVDADHTVPLRLIHVKHSAEALGTTFCGYWLALLGRYAVGELSCCLRKTTTNAVGFGCRSLDCFGAELSQGTDAAARFLRGLNTQSGAGSGAGAARGECGRLLGCDCGHCGHFFDTNSLRSLELSGRHRQVGLAMTQWLLASLTG